MKKIAIARLSSFLLLCALLLQAAPVLVAQNADINAKIREEEKTNSQIMKTMHYLADVYGPRLTGSPNHVAAANWAVSQMKAWGFDDAHLEPWDFGHPGWVNERASGFITSPVQDTLAFEVLAWTPSTKKKKKGVKGQAFQMILPSTPTERPNINLPPTQAELTAYFDSVRAQVKDKMVLIGKPAVIPVNFTPPQKRIDDETLRKRLDPSATPQPFPTPQPTPTPREGQLTGVQVREQLDQFLVDSKAAVRINDAGEEFGKVRAFNNRTFDVTKTVPTVVLRNEDFGRISRLLADGTPVSLEFNIQNRIIPAGTTSFNTIGEIAGSDKKDEVIMLGGHLDSWHAATGATDNAIGCAVMMEAARILKAIGVKPRRTIRVALWSGEEQGLLGSQAYVKQHFGSFENPTAEYAKFGGYFNIDSGTGRGRAMSVFGPAETAAILREAVKGFEDLGMLGVLNTRSRGLGGTDSTSFNQAGLPGIGIQQDPIEYFNWTWHTNYDTYERIIEDDVKASATVVAAALYVLAMRDELLPRFQREQMPALPTPQPTPTPAVSPKPTPKRNK